MMIRITTIEWEYGSGAAQIAEKLAAQLGWKLWDQLLTQEIALAICERSAVAEREERRDLLYYRLVESFVLGSYEGSPGAPVERRSTPTVLLGSPSTWSNKPQPRGDCVIVGRGSQHFLRASDDTLAFYTLLEKKEYDG